ncbi:diguanylate cyclase [Glaciibacter sp. 2TAF33]|uniref:tetratricopeptide repeat-containing diguanylate cyclase n=1 Tax=Glaciibacter sp. 2TAF33 TaxID=3233015 RepID=UPI003F906CFE
MTTVDLIAEPELSVPAPAAVAVPSIDELLAESEAHVVSGQHRVGANRAERVLQRSDATETEKANARAILALHRLRLGDFEASVHNGLLALDYLTDSGDLLRQSKVHSTLALAFTETALNEAALRHVLAALEAARACGDATAEFWALSRSSMVHEAMGDTHRGLELGRQALALARTREDAEAGFAALNNLGDTCQVVAREQRAQGLDAGAALSEARDHMREAVALANAQGHAYWETVARNNMVGILTDLGEYAEAREQAARAKVLAKTNGYRNLEVSIDVQLAEVVRAEGSFALATSMMDSQLADPDLDEYPVLLTRLHRSLYEMHKAAGRFEEALAHHEALHTLVLNGTTEAAGLQSQMLINTLEIEQARHEAERSQHEAELQRVRAEEADLEAHTDPLTRLPNRRALDRHLPALMVRAVDIQQPLCVAMVDFDHFKNVNDVHGHATGDLVLTAMAGMLRAATRDSDLAVRVGGEEFLLVFGNTTLDAATRACERLVTAVRDHPWDGLATGLACTVSVGLAELQADESPEDWLARADAALFAAKHAGRDRVCLATA